MKLWTLQPLTILNEIAATGTYRYKKELSYNLTKQNALTNEYQWLMEEMEQRIGHKPEGVEYPIWAWHTWKGKQQSPDTNSAAFLQRNEDKVLLTLEIPEKEVVLTDFDAWQYVLNGGYVPSHEDIEQFEEIQNHIDSLDENELNRFIQSSWKNVFQTTRIDTAEYQRGYFIQATFWEIKKDYILSTQVIPKNGV